MDIHKETSGGNYGKGHKGETERTQGEGQYPYSHTAGA
jgi:hypothetical protein